MLAILVYLLMKISVHFGNFPPIFVKDAGLQVNLFSLTLSEYTNLNSIRSSLVIMNKSFLTDYELCRAGNEHVQMRKE